jgi:hypothetical protein
MSLAPVLLDNARTPLSTEPAWPSCERSIVPLSPGHPFSVSLPSSQGRKAIRSADLASVNLQKIGREGLHRVGATFCPHTGIRARRLPLVVLQCGEM